MHHLQGAVAEVDDIAMLQLAADGGGLHMIARGIPALWLAEEHFVSGVMREDPFVARVGEDFGFRAVNETGAEFMMAADVIEMGVARHAGEFALGDEWHMLAQAEVAEA